MTVLFYISFSIVSAVVILFVFGSIRMIQAGKLIKERDNTDFTTTEGKQRIGELNKRIHKLLGWHLLHRRK